MRQVYASSLCVKFMRQTGLVLSDLFVRRDWDFGSAAFYGSKVSWRCL